MLKKMINNAVIAMTLCGVTANVLAVGQQYAVDSVIDKDVTVYDANGSLTKLVSLLEAKAINIVFIFGGGGMGHERARDTGGLWCPDSFEDLHILRSLHAAYGEEFGIVPIAVPPAHHTRYFGMQKDIFLNPALASDEFVDAAQMFVDSTQEAVRQGTIPVEAFYDTAFNFLTSENVLATRDAVLPWHGAFRAANESQTYGVPNLWIVSGDGRVLHEPFRGNVYHPHDGKIAINYSLSDVTTALELAKSSDSTAHR